MACDAICSSIFTDRLTPGGVYNEKRLAEQLGISLERVRKALLALESQGVVAFLPCKGVVVTGLSTTDIREVFELRRAIELASVKKICLTCEPDALLPLGHCLEKQRRAVEEGNNPITFMAMDHEFHRLISQLTGNRRVVTIMESIRGIFQIAGLHALATEGRMARVVEEHAKILDAMQTHNVGEALMHMETHLDQSKEAVNSIKS
ncbi:MAG: GntR family transcriptional regulator [Desulfobacterium sp.]|nr:GntR family transcriptional regulator [Desulfobacterium sp.]